MRTNLWFFTSIALAALAISLFPSIAPILRYDRAAIFAGEGWRLLSAHLVHLSWLHVLANLAALALLVLVLGRHARARAWLAVAVVSALGVGVGLLWLSPEVEWYVGLSGVLHGLFVYGAMRAWPTRPRIAAFILIGMAVKLTLEFAMELWAGDDWPTLALAGPVITAAHRYGASAGVIWMGLLTLADVARRAGIRQRD